MIRIACPRCKLLMQTADSAAGQVIACPQCKQQMRLAGPPLAAPVAPPVPDPLPVLSPAPAPVVQDNPFAGIGGEAEPGGNQEGSAHAEFADFTASAAAEEESIRTQRLWDELPHPLPPEIEKLGMPRHIYTSESRTSRMGRYIWSGAGIWLVLTAVGMRGIRSTKVAV